MGGGVHTWPSRQKVLRTACQIAGADAEDGQRNWIPGLTRLRHTSLVVWWSIVLGSTSFRHRSHDPTSINNDCNLVQVCKHWDHSPRRDEQENQEKEKDKNKKRDQGRAGCVSSRESGRFLWRGPYVYRGSTDQWAVRHCLTHVLVARARTCVCWVLTVIQLVHGFGGPRIFLIC